MEHKLINLELRVDKPDNVYRFIYAWKTITITQDDNSFYLIFHALVNWNGSPENIFCIAMQRSREIGHQVDVSEPVHIPEEDIDIVNKIWLKFIEERKGKR